MGEGRWGRPIRPPPALSGEGGGVWGGRADQGRDNTGSEPEPGQNPQTEPAPNTRSAKGHGRPALPRDPRAKTKIGNNLKNNSTCVSFSAVKPSGTVS